jgi:hypothetical protein
METAICRNDGNSGCQRFGKSLTLQQRRFFSKRNCLSNLQAKRRREKSIFVRQYIQKAQAVYNLGSNRFTSVLRAHSPALTDRGCTGHLRRFWNNLMVSGTVLNQLIKDCEYISLTYYCKKIQKQWRTVRIRRFFEACVSRSRYMSTLTQKAKLWKAETGFSHSITGRCVCY